MVMSMWTLGGLPHRSSQRPDSAFGIRLLKFICAIFSVMSLAGAIAAVHPAPLSGAGAIGVIHGRPSVIWELVNALLYAAAFMGITLQRYLETDRFAASFLNFLFRAMSAIQTIPKADHPALAA